MTRRTRLLGLLLAPGLLALAPLTTATATPAPDVVLDATLEPENVFAAPGSVIPMEATVTNTGAADAHGYSTGFEVTGDVTVTVEGGDGCEQVTPQRVECHTDATLAAGASATTTFLVQLPGNVSETIVGDATLHVAGDDGGEDTVTAQLEVGPHEGYRLVLAPVEGVAGAAGETVELYTTAANTGSVDIDGMSLDVEVPAGATIVGATGQDDCEVVSPRRLECHTPETLVAYDGVVETTVQVRFDDDVPAGELGVATVHVAGDEGGEATVDTAEATLTVTAGAGTETGGDENGAGDENGGADAGGDQNGGGTELPNTGRDELADTGATRLPVLLTGAVLLVAGGALLARTRRA